MPDMFGKKKSTNEDTVGAELGLKLLSEGQDTVVDIVAVHGLNGHRETTWTAANQKLWLRDFLPQSIPDARIFIWGYDAATHNTDHVSALHLHDHGQSLVTDLALRRRDNMKRPIIFIAHSLGGLVVKAALIYSYGKRLDDSEHFSIKLSTLGIIFMGTPHLGSGAASDATVILNALSVFVKTNTKMLDHLKQESPQLDLQRSLFANLKDDIRILNCFEALETPHGDEANKNVIQDGVAQELSIHANHRDMARFLDENNRAYASLVDRIKIWKEDKDGLMKKNWPQEPQSSSLLRSFEALKIRESAKFDGMNVAYRKVTNISRLAYEAGAWLFQHEYFRTWDTLSIPFQKAPFLLLNGKPGSGKSTLTKLAVQKALEQGKSSKIVTLFFFFSDTQDGNPLLRSVDGMLRSILCQLIDQTEPQDILTEFMDIKKNEWNLEDLESAIETAITDLTERGNEVRVFLDAINLCSETDVSTILQFLEELVRGDTIDYDRRVGQNLKVFMSSQEDQSHYTNYVPGVQCIIVEDNNQEDLSSFAEYQLATITATTFRQILHRLIVRRAAGIYLWALLIIQDVKRLSSLRSEVDILQHIWQSPVAELSLIYERRMTELNDNEKEDTANMFQLMAFGQKTFTLLQMRHAYALAVARRSPPGHYQAALKEQNFQNRLRKILLGLVEFRSLESSNRGSAVASSAEDETEESTSVVFIHHTVRDYLLDKGLALINPDLSLDMRPKSHFWILQLCLQFMEFNNGLGNTNSMAAPLRRYIGAYKEGREASFAENNLFVEEEDNFLVLIAAEGCSKLVSRHARWCCKCLRGNAQPSNAQPSNDSATGPASVPIWDRALFSATIHRHVKTVRSFRQLDAYKVDPNRMVTRSNAIYKACYLGHVEILKELLSMGADVLREVPSGYRTGLHAAVACDHDYIVKEIFKHHKSDDDAQNIITHGVKFGSESGFNILHMAARFNGRKVAKVILKRIEEMPDPTIIHEVETGGTETAIDIARKHNNKAILKFHDATLVPRFGLHPPNVNGKPVLSSDGLLSLLTFNIAYDSGTFSSERHRLNIFGCYLALAYTGAHAGEIVDNETDTPKDGTWEELYGSQTDEGSSMDHLIEYSCDEDPKILEELISEEYKKRGRTRAICYEDLNLMVVQHPDTGRDVFAMAIKLSHHKGADNKLKP
ncbi:hypothetical protein SCUP515_06440 [Seiridium cupressi]